MQYWSTAACGVFGTCGICFVISSDAARVFSNLVVVWNFFNIPSLPARVSPTLQPGVFRMSHGSLHVLTPNLIIWNTPSILSRAARSCTNFIIWNILYTPPARCRYVLLNERVSFASDTKLAMSSNQFDEAQDAMRKEVPKDANGKPQIPDYHFICEAFFLTAKALKLGLSTGLGELSHMLS